MRLRIPLLAVALAFAALGTARPAPPDEPKDDWKWDPGKRWKPFVGARRICEGESKTQTTDKATLPGAEPKEVVEEEQVSFRATFEVVAVTDSDAISEEKVTFEKWKQVTQEAPDDPDTSLTKKIVHVKGATKPRQVNVEIDAEPASDNAKEWLDSHLGALDDQEERETYRRWLTPSEPIAPNGKWTCDAAIVASAFWPGIEIDPKKSTVTGKLGPVHVKDGVHFGHWEAKAVLSLKKSQDGVEWESAVEEITVSMDGSLELDKSPQEEWKTEHKFTGKGEVKGGKDPGKLEQKAVTTTKQKEGPVEKKP